MTLPAYWVNEEAGGRLPPNDRGLSYGDGVFETFRCFMGRIHLWRYHCQRLRRGLEALNIDCPMERVEAQLQLGKQYLAERGIEHAAGRLTVTRGPGERGYGAVADPPTLILSLSGVVPWREQTPALRAMICATRLADQPALAGIKHCNRLEQVLAARELREFDVDDGLQMNHRDELVCGVSSNLFAVCEGRLLTPPVDRCGVAGIVRALIMDTLAPAAGIPVDVESLDADRLGAVSELLLTNAISGIRNVAQCGTRRFTSTDCGDTLRTHFFSCSESTGW